jgi:hypothetical protein
VVWILEQADVLARMKRHEGEKKVTSDFYRRVVIYTTFHLFERL